MRKKRVLCNTEASWLATGYSTYAREVLSRLNNTAEFELAELASYYDPTDEKARLQALNTPWQVFSNIPADPAKRELYDHRSTHQFGEFSFDEVCLEFKPDIIFDVRDTWMTEHVERSPFRSFFHWVLMPPVDGSPQAEQWLATYANADVLLTYTDWGKDILHKEGGGTLKVVGTASPGADTETFRPRDRREVRDKLGLGEDDFIIGMAARNQIRKLYPDLIRDFTLFLRKAPRAMAKRSFLYLHTTYPDRGWDIPRLIKNSGISHRIIVTYRCPDCGHIMPRHYGDARIHCPACSGTMAQLPSVKNGIGRESLALIMASFDAYVQYAALEGMGMPAVEAASCGVPVFEVDYSAMEDVVRKLNGFPIKVQRFREDIEFGRKWAMPDPEDFVRQLITFLELQQEERDRLGEKARQGVLDHYTWEQAADQWARVFRELPIQDAASTWDSPSRVFSPEDPPGSFHSNEAFVRWAIAHRLGRPDLLGSYLELRLIRDLNWGCRPPSAGGTYQNEDSLRSNEASFVDFGENDLLRELDVMRETFNVWEKRRCFETTTAISSSER